MFSLKPNAKTAHQLAGQRAEEEALTFLSRQGLRLITRNYRCRLGEIDLIMEHHGSLVFIEVRFRKHSAYGTALESVDRKKQARIMASAAHYMSLKKLDRPVRFDVIALSPGPQKLELEWVRDAFQAS